MASTRGWCFRRRGQELFFDPQGFEDTWRSRRAGTTSVTVASRRAARFSRGGTSLLGVAPQPRAMTDRRLGGLVAGGPVFERQRPGLVKAQGSHDAQMTVAAGAEQDAKVRLSSGADSFDLMARAPTTNWWCATARWTSSLSPAHGQHHRGRSPRRGALERAAAVSSTNDTATVQVTSGGAATASLLAEAAATYDAEMVLTSGTKAYSVKNSGATTSW